MKGLELINVVFFLGLFYGGPAVFAIPVIPTLSTAIEVVSFGMDVYSFFDSIIGGENKDESTPPPVDYDRIINSISERIEMSTETIVFKLELQSYISELRDVALTIKQLLADMEDMIKASSKENREEHQKRFRENYLLQKTTIYRIRSLLTFKIHVSGISNTLLSLIANEFECGMTQLEDFENYYMTLVSDVVALALLNEKLSEKSLYSETLASWNSAILSLFDDMEKQKSYCKTQFFQLVSKDFDKINDPSRLFENNKNRYSYKSTDVLFLSGSYCTWYLKKNENIFVKKQNKTVTFLVINAEESDAAHNEAQYLKITSAARFDNCMEDTGKILSYFDVLGEDLIFWLMFPRDRSADSDILLHQNSTASKINTKLDGIKYTVVFYVRAQADGGNSSLSVTDFDTIFYEDVQDEEHSGLTTSQVAATISFVFSLAALALILFVGGRKYRRCQSN